jgi:hypothetical protein
MCLGPGYQWGLCWGGPSRQQCRRAVQRRGAESEPPGRDPLHHRCASGYPRATLHSLSPADWPALAGWPQADVFVSRASWPQSVLLNSNLTILGDSSVAVVCFICFVAQSACL